jgi:hypothetical protein
MLECAHHGRPRKANEFGEARCAAHRHPQREQIGEGADERLAVAGTVAGDGTSDDEIRLRRIAEQQRVEGGQQRDVERCAVTAAEHGKPAREFGGQRRRPCLRSCRPVRAARRIGRQLDARRRAGERVAPIRQMAFRRIAVFRSAFGPRNVRILNRQLAKYRSLTAVVQREFPIERPQRRRIEDHARCRDEQQMVIRGEPDQDRPQ